MDRGYWGFNAGPADAGIGLNGPSIYFARTDFETRGAKDFVLEFASWQPPEIYRPVAQLIFRSVRKTRPDQEGRELISRNRGIDPRAYA